MDTTQGVTQTLTKHRHFSPFSIFEKAYRTFSPAEKMVFGILACITILTSFLALTRLYSTILITIPSKGGSYTEGIIGTPRFINPLLTISDADRDLATLVYAGLMKSTPDGGLAYDMAREYTVSNDGLQYDFYIKDDALFHDMTPVTAYDVEFTIKKAQDSLIKSQKKSAWDGVSVNVLDEHHIRFTLKQPYAPFIQNTTLGILPQHIWKDTNADGFIFSLNNIEPVGSGPYKIDSVKFDKNRAPTEYILTSFSEYIPHAPYISKITIKLYQKEADMIQAYKDGKIDAMGGIDPETLGGTDIDTSTVHTAELPRIFGVFFNQNQNNILLDSSVRKALDIATNRTALIDEALAGQGKAIDTPISFKQKEAALWSDDAIQQAGKILDAAGWKLNTDTGIREKTAKGTVTPLSFTLTTADTIDLKVTAENLKSQWMKIGVDVTIQVYENGDLNQNIIRPRKYEALLFGEIIGRDYDLYPFWHSSERNDPGLNIALYTNIKTDKLLETLRTSSDTEIRTDALAEFIAEIQKDHPALFLYTPYYLYITRNTIQSIDINTITFGSERFLNVADWYIETNAVWSIFTKNKL